MTKQRLCSRSEDLPAKFTAAERAAYVWLWDCKIEPWMVDLATKQVTTPEVTYANLVEFRKAVEESQ